MNVGILNLSIVAAYLVVPLVLLLVGRDSGWWQAWAFSLFVHVAGVGGRALEDHTLRKELPGYREYARRVPYRLFPGLW